MPLKISSIILNWNRLPLLKRTIASYLATAPSEHQLFVVDNSSTDGSVEYLRQLAKETGQFEFVPMAENIGGRAVNSVLPRCEGDLIQFIENDQEFVKGWFEYTERVFEGFKDLGQLSLFAPVPTDDEAWETKPSHLRFSNGEFIYQAHANCGFSSVLRASLARDHNISIKNVSESSEYLFPDDAQLSMDVKNLGYICAYSKQYFVRNLGHFVEEFERDEGYYLKNYESKPWLGEAGWRARIAARQNMSKPSRSTHLFKSEAVLPEKTTVAVGEKPAALWSMLDGFTAEVEVLEFLYAFVRLVKPSHILETGTWRGFSACAMGHALSRNGFGRITTLEYNPEIAEVASANLSKMHQSENVTVVVGDSREFVPTERIDFALLDSDISIRHLEFLHFKEHFSKSAFVAFHDVAPHHGALNDNVQGLIREGLIHGLDFPTPRGLFLGRVLN